MMMTMMMMRIMGFVAFAVVDAAYEEAPFSVPSDERVRRRRPSEDDWRDENYYQETENTDDV